MSEQTNENPQQYPEQLSDVLLVMDKEKKKIQAVTGVDENGNLKTVDATKKNQSQFMRVDRAGDLFTNFFSNFWRQLKDPTHFSFFKVPAKEAVETAKEMQKQVDAPTKEGEAVMAKHEVKEPEQTQETKTDVKVPQATTETQEKNDYRYKVEDVDWTYLAQFGIVKERLEKDGQMDLLLKGYKTNKVYPTSVNFGAVIMRSDARLGFQDGEDGKPVLMMYGVRHEPNLKSPFFGHEFTKEDRENLLKTGNMGRVVELTNRKTGEKIPSIISIDHLTNEVIAFRQDRIKIPDEIKGVKLTEDQKQDLKDGKAIYLEGLDFKNSTNKNAHVQFNADKKYTEFLFGDKAPKQVQENDPKHYRGKTFSDEQYKQLTEGKTLYVSDFKDGQGNPYKGYVTLNKETGGYGFSFKNPNALKNKAQPAETHKTQVAVNSEGKTNEATKNIREALKPEQQTPKNKTQQQRQNEPNAPAKSKGVRR
ncbi:DUF3945 domain-containing protein [Myroides odoratimimus]|uniref:DUF3945 domain-containing protein n=1 Tax=Myroides odoratimimus TaxID=76832 RepID=UPI00217F994B|nr:DUF3945 domain-containing protein [Myroides odoratimimus]MCS7472500.1 DUF3945 domain-containing protein [Myroides odoratimimus]MDM1086436.1 DUF3945 domain-containing protein [Myroides odoratimimus]